MFRLASPCRPAALSLAVGALFLGFVLGAAGAEVPSPWCGPHPQGAGALAGLPGPSASDYDGYARNFECYDCHRGCTECHDVGDMAAGAHGDPLTGVYRMRGYPDFPRGDCVHCHDPYGTNPFYLYRPYTTDEEQRALCLSCHDDADAPFPEEPPSEHASSSSVLCVTCHDKHMPLTGALAAGPGSGVTAGVLRAWPRPYRGGFLNVSFTAAGAGAVDGPLDTELVVHDVAGRMIRRLAAVSLEPGAAHTVRWDGRGDDARPVGNGVYYLLATTRAGTHVEKLVVVR